MSSRIYNFSAGPGVLPVEVLEQARDEMLNWHGAGMSVMEMSHRSKAYDQIIAEAEADMRSFLGIPDNYKVLFLQGGASLQFTMLAKAFLKGSGDYIVTGSWGEKAVEAAKYEGTANVIYSGKADKYNSAPAFDSLNYTDGADYVHYTMNETIQGVDFNADPPAGKNWICDMSSNIGSRRMDFSKNVMIYAGAQKNLGPAGLTIAIIQDEFLASAKDGIPPMLDYKLQAENGSRYNTPPTWPIYVCGLIFKHWISRGGLEVLEKANDAKAQVLYDAIDNSGGFYKGHAVKANRSRMNIPFTLPSDELTNAFVKEAEANGMSDLKGHRSVGGCRASVYNAFPIEGARALADFMKQFQAKNG